jgi:hypothetical protein
LDARLAAIAMEWDFLIRQESQDQSNRTALKLATPAPMEWEGDAMTVRSYKNNWQGTETGCAAQQGNWVWDYLATFVVCLLISSPLGFMAGMLTARMVSLTLSFGQIPEIAYITWAGVAMAIQVMGMMQTRKCQLGHSPAVRA